MNLSQINDRLINCIGDKLLSFDQVTEFEKLLDASKRTFLENNDQQGAKRVWIIEQILLMHKHFVSAFQSMKRGQFYEAWCSLEKSEIRFGFLSSHFQIEKDDPYFIDFVIDTVRKLQSLFPYKVFMSPEMLYKETECTICGKEYSIRNSCGHEIGEIYDGIMCGRKITKLEFLGVSVVKEPHQKYSVAFPSQPDSKKRKDPYHYKQLEYLVSYLHSAYDEWDVVITKKLHGLDKFKDVGRNNSCPCGSDNKFKRCCLNKGGVELPHYEFHFKNLKSATPPHNVIYVLKN